VRREGKAPEPSPSCLITEVKQLLSCDYNLGMRYVAVLVIVLIWAVAATSPASAHRPYFTQVEKLLLPNGEIGEARLLNGDGIIGPDPVRVIILDAQDRLLARSHKSRSMALSCQADRQCLIFDYSAGKVLDLVPASFRQGAPVPGLSDEARNDLWELEGGSENWGFALRSATPREKLLGYVVLVSSRLPLIAFNIVMGPWALCY
jgi:hypothetical protein